MRCIQQLKERIMYIRRAIKTCAFILGLVLLLTLSSRILMPKDNTEEAGMEEVYANGILGEKEDSIDVLIVGDSYSYTFPIPPEIWRDCGYTTYTWTPTRLAGSRGMATGRCMYWAHRRRKP